MEKTVVIVLREDLRIRLDQVDPATVKDFRDEFTYKNPNYGKMRAMGFRPPASEPPQYRNYEILPGEISLFRGSATRVKKILEKRGYKVKWVDKRSKFPEELSAGELSPRPYQAEAIPKLIKQQQGLLRGRTGSGKCLGRGTQVVMADGSRRAVEDLRVGDFLMGPDSKPRRVLSVSQGHGPLYQVTPIKGEAWVCNDAHVLSLVSSGTRAGLEKGAVYNVPVTEYLQLTKSQRHVLKLWRTGFELPETETKLPPYYLGLWLGDGRFDGPVICKDEQAVEHEVQAVAQKFGLRAVRYDYGNRMPTFAISGSPQHKNPIQEALEEARCDGEKRIPDAYLRGSRAQRLELLAGIIDTDGYVSLAGAEVITRYPGLADDIAFLARGLGFGVSVSTKLVRLTGWEEARAYLRLLISGDLSTVPMRIERKQGHKRQQKKSVLRTGFKLEPLGEGEYFGFTLDEDHLFLLGDCTVTHNTETMLSAIVEAGQRTCVIVWNKDLQKQWVERILKYDILSEGDIGGVGGIFNRAKMGPITIAMQQSLIRNLGKWAPLFGTVVMDECQRAPANTFIQCVNSFPAYYRWGATADERRNDRKEFLVYDGFGEIIHELDSGESTMDPEIVLVPTYFEDYEFEETRVQHAMIERLVKDEQRNRLIEVILRGELKDGRQCLLFTERVDAAIHWSELVSSFGIAAGGLIGGTDFAEATSGTLQGLKSGDIRFAASTTYAEVGLDVPSLDCGFLTCPVGNPKRLEQMVGRFVRRCEGKRRPRVYFFWDRAVTTLSSKHKIFAKLRKKWPGMRIREVSDEKVRKILGITESDIEFVQGFRPASHHQ